MKIPRASLHSPELSAWEKLYGSGIETALICFTGFDHSSFRYLLEKFESINNTTTPHTVDGKLHLKVSRSGRTRLLNAAACLVMYLAWTRTQAKNFHLCMHFGMTASSVSIYIRFARRILLSFLQVDDNARLRIPTSDKIEEYKGIIAAKYPTLEGAFSMMDGLRMEIEQTGDHMEQCMYYNGWKSDHTITNVFVFVPDGTIIIAGINMPGCYHDSVLAEDLKVYETLEQIYNETGGKCVVDSAFNLVSYGHFLYKSSQSVPTTDDGFEIIRNDEATQFRQSAEWGMRALQGSFPRLKAKLKYERNGERELIILSIIMLYNLRANLVGQNQIRTVFMPYLNLKAEDYSMVA